MNIRGKTAVITGAGSLQGRQIALCLAKKGAHVVLLDRPSPELDRTEEEIRSCGADAAVFVCDVTNPHEVDAAAEETKRTVGPCRFLINAAGDRSFAGLPADAAFGGPTPPVLDPGTYEQVMNSYTMGTLVPTLAFSRQMAEQGGGSIVNFTLAQGTFSQPFWGALAAGKAAIASMTRSMAEFYSPAGIRINAVEQQQLPLRPELFDDEGPVDRALLECILHLLQGRPPYQMTGCTVSPEGRTDKSQK